MERRYRSKKVSAMQQSAVIEQRSSIPANLIVQNSKSGQTLTKVALRCPSKKSIQVYFCFLPWLVAVLCWPSGAPSYRPRSTTLGACHASRVSSREPCHGFLLVFCVHLSGISKYTCWPLFISSFFSRRGFKRIRKCRRKEKSPA